MHSFFKELKNLDLSGNCFLKNCPCIYMHALLFVVLISIKALSSCNKCLESLFDKFLTKTSRLDFINYMLSVNVKFLLIVKTMHFSNQFDLTLTPTSNLLI